MKKNIISKAANKNLAKKTEVEEVEDKVVGILFTSTPQTKKKMEFSFSDGSVQFVMEGDSGYASRNYEMFDGCTTEGSGSHIESISTMKSSIYLSEDALLEQPLISIKSCEKMPSSQQSDTTTIINSSCISMKSTFSGFDSDESTDENDLSFTIPTLNKIIINENNSPNNKESLVNNDNNNDNKPKLVLTNLTNICDNRTKCPLTKVSVKNSNLDNKENIPCVIKTPQKRQQKNPINSDLSPDLFSDDESIFNTSKRSSSSSPQKKYNPCEKYVNKKDLKLLKNVQAGLSGVFPPPSVTIVQMSVNEMLNKIEENKALFCDNTLKGSDNSLLINANYDEMINREFPEILEIRFHGLHHNRSKYSEEFELLCSKYAQRFVGAETQSSCTAVQSNFPSPSKRKLIKKVPAKSPGRRLSHLARRRITFSSANLQSVGTSSIVGSRAKQILVDTRKLNQMIKRKSPRKSPRKTPSKSPFKLKRLTPSSSAKKRTAAFRARKALELDCMPSTSSEPTLRRALFQSPEEPNPNNLYPSASDLQISNSAKKSTKRALFTSPIKSSPSKKSPMKSLFDRKRKRNDSLSVESNPLKLPRTSSMMEFRSKQSDNKLLTKSLSESTLRLNTSRTTEELSEIHKKKLQWAVYESLKMQNILPSHSQFKIFASVLARVTRRFLPSLAANAPRPEEGTSERMLRIARYHAYAVVKGKSVDEIINEYLKNKAKHLKPHGYIGLEEFEKENNKENNENNRKKETNSRIDRIKKVISFEDKR